MSVIRRAIVGSNAEFSIIDVNGTNRVLETHSSSFIDPQTSVVRATLYEISTELLTSSKYIYVISGPVSIVSGQDNSPESKNLRFTSLNNIKVFVNGIEIPEATIIPPQPGFNRSVDDQITFDPTIYESNNVVEVFVYQKTSTLIGNSKQVVLEFRSLIPTVLEDYAFRELDCWGDYSAVKIEDLPPGMSPNERFILFCTDLTGLNINKSYGVASFDVTISSINYQVKNSEVFILLGKEPFAFRDKELYAYLTGTSLIDNSNVLTYNESVASGSLFLTVDETAIEQVFNPIIPSRTISTVQPIVSTTVPGTLLAGSENLSQKYIIGPT
jgi:hypothetical protein